MSHSDWMVVECEEGHPRFVNGQEIPNWQQGPKILVAIQHLGSFHFVAGLRKVDFYSTEKFGLSIHGL
jgi:hypothetical protein